MARVLVSACLLGRACRYDGADEEASDLIAALARMNAEAIAFCPEQEAGLGTPRPAAHLVDGDGYAVADGTAKVIDENGRDVTGLFLEGANLAARKAAEEGCSTAFLKENSPSCGCGMVHTDKGLVRGCGVTTALLRRAGVATISIR